LRCYPTTICLWNAGLGAVQAPPSATRPKLWPQVSLMSRILGATTCPKTLWTLRCHRQDCDEACGFPSARACVYVSYFECVYISNCLMTVAPDFHSGVPALEDSSVSYVCNSDAAKCIKMRVPGDHVAQGAAWSSEPMAWHVLRRSFDCLRVPSCQG